MKPSMMSFVASRFSATDAPSWERHHPRTRCSTAEAASSPILADAIVFSDITFERIVEYRSNTSAKDSAMTVYEPGSVDDVARYQANKLAKEGDAAFVRACGEFARNDAFRSLNETIIANVGRDRDEGAMFARVPTGTETCTFCLMLASRGAVYHTRKTAGEWRHFHRGCDCKVVPSFEDDPDAELVQGVKPRELYERIVLMERQTGFSFADSKASRKLSDFMALHDRDWLLTGKVPEVGYEDEATQAKKLKDKDHPAEVRVANRLRVHGLRTVFVDDEVRSRMKKRGVSKSSGYPIWILALR